MAKKLEFSEWRAEIKKMVVGQGAVPDDVDRVFKTLSLQKGEMLNFFEGKFAEGTTVVEGAVEVDSLLSDIAYCDKYSSDAAE